MPLSLPRFSIPLSLPLSLSLSLFHQPHHKSRLHIAEKPLSWNVIVNVWLLLLFSTFPPEKPTKERERTLPNSLSFSSFLPSFSSFLFYCLLLLFLFLSTILYFFLSFFPHLFTLSFFSLCTFWYFHFSLSSLYFFFLFSPYLILNIIFEGLFLILSVFLSLLPKPISITSVYLFDEYISVSFSSLAYRHTHSSTRNLSLSHFLYLTHTSDKETGKHQHDRCSFDGFRQTNTEKEKGWRESK